MSLRGAMRGVLLDKMPPMLACCSGYTSSTEGHDVDPPCPTLLRIEEIISDIQDLFDGYSETTASVEFEIAESTKRISREIALGRVQAAIKHGDNSIEAISGRDIVRWLPILGEEFGEVCASLTYDKDSSELRGELVDVLCVASAWIAALDQEEGHDGH